MSTSKRILVVGHAGEIGGAQTAFRKLTEFLVNDGHDVRLVAISDSDASGAAAPVLETIPHHLSMTAAAGRKARRLLAAAWKTKRFGPEVMICVGLNKTALLLRRFVPKSCHTLAQDFIADRTYGEPVWRETLARFHAIAMQSPSMVAKVPASAGRARIGWLPCFSETLYAEVAKRVRTSKPEGVTLGYFGRLAANKGLSHLIHAFRRCDFEGDVKLNIWGGGAEREALQRLIESLGLEGRVGLKGVYPAGLEGARLMASHDALVLTSTGCEGLPLVLIEASGYGLPILATDVGAMRDCCVGNPGAILVEPGEDAVAKGLELLVRTLRGDGYDPEAILRFHREHFSAEAMASRWRRYLQDPRSFFNLSIP